MAIPKAYGKHTEEDGHMRDSSSQCSILGQSRSVSQHGIVKVNDSALCHTTHSDVWEHILLTHEPQIPTLWSSQAVANF